MTDLLRKTSFAPALAAFTACLGLSSSIAHAQIVTVPTGLNPGDMYRLMFVTSGVGDATSTDIADYNAFVSASANAVPALADLQTEWFVIGSTETVNALNNTGTPLASPGEPVYRLDDTQFATSNTDLWDGDLPVPMNLTELDTVLGATDEVFTGTLFFGQADTPLELGTANVTYGWAGSLDGTWTRVSNFPATSLLSFYAISAPITVPEPSSVLLGAGALIALGITARQRQRA